MLRKREHSVDTESVPAAEELRVQAEPLAGDTNTETISNSASSPSTSLQASQTELGTKEHQAAVVIQSAFRAFLVCKDNLVIVFLPKLRKAYNILHSAMQRIPVFLLRLWLNELIKQN